MQFISSFRPHPWQSCSCAKESKCWGLRTIPKKDDNRHALRVWHAIHEHASPVLGVRPGQNRSGGRPVDRDLCVMKDTAVS